MSEWKKYVKKGTVSAVHLADGSVELRTGEVVWKTSPRSLSLCYDAVGPSEYRAKAKRVLARRLTEDTPYDTLGGKKKVATKGSVLLAWGPDLKDCWALDEEVFDLRYEEDKGEEKQTARSVVAETPISSSSASSAPSESSKGQSGGGLSFGAASLQGKRPENEDTHLTLSEWKEGLALFAVFDGHGGADASAFCAKKLPLLLEVDASDPTPGFVESFVAVDRKYLKKNNDDGTTALVAVVDKKSNKVHVANAGDSRAILIRGGKAIGLSNDHKPALAAEKKRIEAASFSVTVDTLVLHGKRVKVPRIDGKLAVSRAIGDDSFKDVDDEPATWAVTSVPEVLSHDVQGGDTLVLACDGLFDVCDNDFVAGFVTQHSQTDANSLATLLAEEAINKGSDDNVTVVVIRL